MGGFCPKCGSEYPPQGKFCTNCGAPMEKDRILEDKNEIYPLKEPGQLTDRGVFLFLSLISISVFPGILGSLLMLVTKQSLNTFAVFLFEFIGAIAGLFFMALYFLKISGRALSKGPMIISLNGILWAFVTITLSTVLLDFFEGFALSHLFDVYWIYFIVVFLVMLLTAMILLIIGRSTLRKLSMPGSSGTDKPKKSPFLIVKLMVFMVVLMLIPESINMTLNLLPIHIPLSFVNTMGINIFTLFLQALLLHRILGDMAGVIGPLPDAARVKTKKVPFSPLIPLVIIGALFIHDLAAPVFTSVIDGVLAGIRSDINYGSIYLSAGDLDLAIKLYDRAHARGRAWMAFLGNDNEDINTLRNIYNSNPSDEEIEYLTAIKTFSLEELENLVLTKKSSTTWYLTLLNAYKESPPPLTERQRAIRRDLMMSCIASEHFVNEALTLKDIKGREEKIAEALKPQMEFIEYYDSYKILSQVTARGGMNNDIMDRLLKNAEENTTNLLSQYLAFAAGSTYLFDGARHYRRTSEAAMRFGKLFMENLGDNPSPPLVVSVNLEVANALMAVLDYENAVYYLEVAAGYDDNVEIFLMGAKCYEELENFEKCKDMANEALKVDPENRAALHLAMLSALKSGSVLESMELAARLLDGLLTFEGEDFMESDAQLYNYIQYLTVYDLTSWTPQMKYKVYPKLGEDEQKFLDKNPLLEDYIKALHFTFDSKVYDEALIHAQRVLEKLPGSAQIHYLMGTIHYNNKNFEGAVDSFRASLDIYDHAPTIWFSLANAYDGLGNYKEAYNCTLKVDDMLEHTDHGQDIYGVKPHNTNLMNALKKKQ